MHFNDDSAQCRLATTAQDMDHVYRLRYACYLRKGAIAENEDQRFSDEYDLLPNHFSFLVEGAGEALATVRISVVQPALGWVKSPSAKVFGDHAAYQCMASESFVEASRLCFHEQARRDVLFRLVANMAALADRYDTKWLLACPRAEHSHMYQRLFGFKVMAPARQYFGVNFQTELLGTEREELRAAGRRVAPIQRAWNAATGALLTVAQAA